MANFSADNAFWPPLPGISDLTLKFEETVLELTPSSLIIALSPVVIAQNLQQPVQVRRSPLLWIKLLVAAALVGLEIAALTLRAADQSFLTETTLAAASVDLAAAIAVTVVLYVEHCHALRSSALLGIYFFVAAVFDAVKCRSFFARPGLAPVGALAAAACGLKMLLLILQEMNKRYLFIDPELTKSLGTESTTGYWKRMLFTYLNPMFMTGFRKALKLKDLGNIGPEFSSKILHAKLKGRLNRVRWASKNTLMRICFETWMGLFLLVLIPRVCFTGFSFAQPFILHRVIDTLDEPEMTNGEKAFLLCATFLSFAGSALSKMATAHLSYRLVTRLRGALVTQISEKNARLPQCEAKKSAAITLMSTDVDGMADGLPDVFELVMTFFEVGLGIYALSLFVGRSCFVVIAPLIAATVATYFLGDWIGSAYALWNESIEARVAKTSKILGQLKAVKMFGLGTVIGDYLQRLRQIEMMKSKRFRILEAASTIPIVCAELITPVTVIAAALFWNTFSGKMSAATVFPALSIIVLVKTPLATLLNAYPTITSMVTCFQRIQEFLQLPEREDARTLRETADVSPLEEKANGENPATWPLVEFARAKLAPLGAQDSILEDVSFSLYPGSITIAIGPNGAGKSFLLQSILGETSLVDGAIYITTLLMGFCGQTIWLRNASIKENIIGHLPYDEKLFRRVVRCCLLEEDFATLPMGENYVVGSGGSKLSGGQRQRVGLARALFARMSIIVLDDVFSSLDRKTAISILLRLCGEDGLLKELNTAVVVSSYLPECIDVADQVLMLDGKGSVSSETNLSSGKSRQKVLKAIKAATTAKSEDNTEEQSQLSDAQEPSEIEDPETNARQKGDPSLYWLFVNPIGKVRLSLWCTAMFFCSAGEIFPDIYMRIWIERHPGDNSYFAGYASIAIATCLLFFLTCAVLFANLMPRAALKLHDQMVRTLMRATLGYLGVTDNGVLVNRFSQDMSLIARRLPVSFMRTFYVLFTAIIQCDVVVSGASYMAAVIPVVFLAVYCIQHFYLRTSRQMRALDLEAKSPLYTHFEETTEGILYIRAFGWQKMTLEEGFHLLDDSQKAFYYMYCIQQWLGLVLGLLVAVMATILIAFVLFMRESTSQTAIGLAFLNLIFLSQTLEQLVMAWTSLETTVGALARLRDFLDKTPQEPKQGEAQLPENWPSVGKVRLQNISARYSAETESAAVLKNVSLSVDGGQKVALVGRTGSGKSSVLLALLGFLECTGKINIDGVDISSIPLDTLRSRIVTISQDQIKLDNTVRTNLRPFSLNDDKDKMSEQQKQEAKDKDIKLEELLTRLGIWSHLGEKGGLDAMLDDIGYSHGEMQLFCLARGIMRYKDTGSKVVLVDEATSSVEEEREKVAQELMRESFPGCTVLVVGHRQSSITGVDVTVELAKGEVVRVVKNEPESGGWSHSD